MPKPQQQAHVLTFTPSAEDHWKAGLTKRYCRQRKNACLADLMDIAAAERQERFIERGRDRDGPAGALSHVHADHSAGLLAANRDRTDPLMPPPKRNVAAMGRLSKMWGWRLDRACVGLAQLLEQAGASPLRIKKFKTERAAARAAFKAHLQGVEAKWGRTVASNEDAVTALRLYGNELGAIAKWCDEAQQPAVAAIVRRQLADAQAAMEEVFT